MKKTFLGVLGTAVLLSMCVTTAFAAGPGCGRWFTDADGDGICDNAGAMCAFVDADGDGVCDNLGSGQGRGSGYGFRGGCGFRGGRCR